MKDISVIVATHKKYFMPSETVYLPVHVGGKLSDTDFGYQKDSTGDNISQKNPYFCELTGLYWAWKNLDSDYIGLVHYRRYFTLHKHTPKDTTKKFDLVLSGSEINELLKKTDVILPKKRKYYIENLYDHYKHTMYVEPLDETRKIIEERYPEYLKEFDNLIGIDKIRCIHINDSKNPLGSKKDRHENIGYGYIGYDNLINVIYNDKLKNVPKILETPYIGDFPPYKFEIEMIKDKKFNPNLTKDVSEYYKNL